MTRILKNGQFEQSLFQLAQAESDLTADHIVVPMKVFIENQDTLAGRNDVGVWLAADEQIEEIEEFVHSLPVIALDFPAFGDGRSCSNAVVLRKHFGFAGELRAVGDVRVDQLEQLIRCGFDAFNLAEGQDEDVACDKLQVFRDSYQTTLRDAGIIDRRARGALS